LLLLLIILMLLWMKGLLALKEDVVVEGLVLNTGPAVSKEAVVLLLELAVNTSEKSVSRCTPARPFREKWVTLTGRPAVGAGTAVRGGGRWAANSSRLEGGAVASGSRSTNRLEAPCRLRVSLSPPWQHNSKYLHKHTTQTQRDNLS